MSEEREVVSNRMNSRRVCWRKRYSEGVWTQAKLFTKHRFPLRSFQKPHLLGFPPFQLLWYHSLIDTSSPSLPLFCILMKGGAGIEFKSITPRSPFVLCSYEHFYSLLMWKSGPGAELKIMDKREFDWIKRKIWIRAVKWLSSGGSVKGEEMGGERAVRNLATEKFPTEGI